jgi:hypothetical protein
MLPGVPERCSFDYIRHGTTDLFAVLDTGTGKVIGKVSARHAVENFRDFLDLLDHEVEPDLAAHLTCDNLSAHKAPVVHQWLVAHPRDSLYVLDVLYDSDGGKRPEMIVTDTASYSDLVFGLLTLAGFAYAPQLADLPDQKMWRIDGTADYGALQDAARGRVDLARIERHWEDILRIIGPIHTGAVCAYDVIRMLSRDGRPTPLGDAIAHYGRIAKTLHILRLADEPATAGRSRARPTSRRAATRSPGRSSTAGPGSSTSATRTAWRTRSVPSAWPSTPSSSSTPGTWTPRSTSCARTVSPSATRTSLAFPVRAAPHQHARPVLLPASRPARRPAAPARQGRHGRLVIRARGDLADDGTHGAGVLVATPAGTGHVHQGAFGCEMSAGLSCAVPADSECESAARSRSFSSLSLSLSG